MSQNEPKKVQDFVKAVIGKDNVHAAKTLEDILREKCAKKIAETLKS